MTCNHCTGTRTTTHRSLWHESRTCTQVDQDAAKIEEAELLQALQKNGTLSLRKCPECGQGTEKNDSCDHMTYLSEAHRMWTRVFNDCWRCLAPYGGVDGIRSVGKSAHKASCKLSQYHYRASFTRDNMSLGGMYV